MSATPYPQNLLHSDAAQPLQLNAQVTVPPSGDMELAIAGDASVAGWPVIPVGQKMVVTVARDTAYEKKYLVSSITAGTYVSTFEIVAADREYDGLQPTAAPAGSTVEHTVSAVELATVNDHMRAKAAHGSDGDLIDADSAQTLTNKTLTSPTFTGAAASDLPMGGKKVTGLANGSGAQDAATKAQVDAAQSTANAALPKAGGTMSGDIAMGGKKVTGLANGSGAQDAATKAQVDAAQSTANAALPKAGGTMGGNLVMDVGAKVAGATGDLTIHTPTGQVVLQGPAGTPASGQIAHANADFANQSATLGQVPSSRDVKQNIAPLTEQQRATFDQIDPVAFEYRPGQGPNEVEQDGTHLGFIAEDVRDAGLRIVEDPDGGVVALQPIELIAVLWAKVQDLEARLEAAQR